VVGAGQIQTRLWRVAAHKGHGLVCEGDRGEVWGGGSQLLCFRGVSPSLKLL
jgi:hypothetical protein